MSKLVSTSYVYISSVSASASNQADITVAIPEDSIRCKNDEYIMLSMCQFSMVNSLYNVTASNQTFRVGSTNYVLPVGHYKVGDLAGDFNGLSNGLRATYYAKTNKFTFSNTTASNLPLTFFGNLTSLYGLSNATVTANGSVESTSQVVPRVVNDVVIRMAGAMPGPPCNLDNLGRANLTTSQILGIAPLRAAPGLLSVHLNFNDCFRTILHDPDVQNLNFRLFDMRNELIQDCPPWSMVLKVDVHKRVDADPVADSLNQLVEYSRLGFLRSALKDPSP